MTGKRHVDPMDYAALHDRILALTEGEDDPVALMATMACELHHSDPRFDWTGFYRVTGPDLLKIGPYQGGHGCLRIPFGRGVCGTCAQTGEVQIVPDVEVFQGHIACSSSTRSEIVLPVWDRDGELLGVLDIDSDRLDAFDERDARELSALLKAVFAR
ncbi:MAG: GAF domain-containing protein [Pseudomonadota bacterium]